MASNNWLNRMIKENFKDENMELKNEHFDISSYKSPNKIPDERQFRLSFKKIEDEKYAKLSFLPGFPFVK